jgi:hypothetical protein
VHRHKHFDLWLHDDEELAPLVQGNILERMTLHEWPLSCVQRLTLADGRKLIYKTQFGPTVESEFYANARSSLLPSAKTIYRSEGHVCMLFEFVEGPLVEKLDLPEEEVVRVGQAVIAQIAEIPGKLPHYIDVSDEEKWAALVDTVLSDLRELIDQGKFSLVDQATVRILEHRALSESVLSTIRTDHGYVHRDLDSGNLFVMPDGYRVIDWQRPILGPTDLDMAQLLESLEFDPLRHVGEGVVRVLDFLNIHWFTQCAARWFPEGMGYYDEQVVQLVSRMEDASK